MPLNRPFNGDERVSNGFGDVVSRIGSGLRASAFAALAAVAGCGEAPVPSTVAANVLRVAHGEKEGIERTATTSYVAEPAWAFDVGIALPETSGEPTLVEKHGGKERELPRAGTSVQSGVRASSYRVSPPEGGWTREDNGEHEIVAKTAKGDTVVARFTVAVADDSVRVERASEAAGTHLVTLRFRSDGKTDIDARRLARSRVVLRSNRLSDVPLRLEIPPRLRDAPEIAIDASTGDVPPGTYDVVLLDDVPAGARAIAKGTVATITVD